MRTAACVCATASLCGLVGCANPEFEHAGYARAEAAAMAHGRFVLHPSSTERFHVNAFINGEPIRFTVDTGANVVTLNSDDAARVGVSDDGMLRCGNTANGTVCGRQVVLESLNVGGIVRHDVVAFVLPSSRLSDNLLGMSFLGSLAAFSYSREKGTFTLEQ